jgi:chromosome segregation protein
MRFFKRLEIQGFKSFANRTVIDFHTGVTVVVGPNGCGKSNVFDSIRWVLGEQSARSLRGSKMGDVLFNGSAAARPAAFSKVTLVLDNSQRHLPIDFDEVAIGRRLYRNGDSEYVLNGQVARLRDIAALLLDTGIGTDGYSVMEQGRVDAIINSRPLERRALFDEAAGIAKYKARKEEALNKLRRTEEDMLRVADLLGEVRSQTNRLQRQAQKAARARMLSEEQDLMERQLLARKWFQACLAGQAGEEAWVALGQRVERLRGELEQVQADEKTAQEAVEQAQRAFEQGQDDQGEIGLLVQELRGRLDVIEERIAGWNQRMEVLQREADAHAMERMAIVAADTGAEDQRRAHSIQMQELKTQLEQAQADFEQLRLSGDSSAQKVAALRTQANELSRLVMEATNRARTAELMADRAATERDLARMEFRELEDQKDTQGHNLRELEEAFKTTENARNEARESRKQIREKLHSLEQKLKEATARYEKVRRQRQDSATRHQALERLQDSHEGYFRGVKDVMLSAQAGRLSGIVGVAATLMEAKPDHEVAIETALGGQAQDIVVKTAEDGKAAIRFLKESKVGRATFLPLDLLDPREVPQALKNQVRGQMGVIGWAVDLVRYSAEVRLAIQYLLGGVLVVDQIDTAIRLQRQGVRTRLVTLDGELINPSGAMSGGSAKAAGLLPRTREIRELAEQLQQLRAEEERLSQQGQAMVQDHQQAKLDTEAAAQAEQEAEIKLAQVAKDLEVARRQAEDIEQRLERSQARAKTLAAEVDQHRERATTAQAEADSHQEKLSGLEAQLEEVAGQATEQQGAIDEAGKKLRDLELAVSAGAERARTLEERAANAQKDLARLEAAAKNRQGEVDKLQADLTGARENHQALLHQYEEAQEKARKLADSLVWDGQKREAAHLDLRRVHERIQALMRDYNQARNELHELEVRKAETGVQQEAIRLQVQERFQSEMDPFLRQALGDLEKGLTLGRKRVQLDDEVIDLETLAETMEMGAAGESSPEGDAQNQNLPPLPLPVEALKLFPPMEQISQRLGEIRRSLDSLGAVHSGAIEEWREARQRLVFLTNQEKDLREAKEHLSETIAKLDEASRELFLKAFTDIRDHFAQVFRRLFGGGRADLLLTEESGVLESGIDVVAMPPGKKLQHISLLSGGEKALTAVALLLAIFLHKPSPFCILDEIDAPLDDKNVERFKEVVREFSKTTQFIIITHNKQTMALADSLYGVTMQEQGVSRVVSVRLDQVDGSGRVRGEVLDQTMEPQPGDAQSEKAGSSSPVGAL